jgi:hypothetical protein
MQVLAHATTEFQRTADQCVEAPKSLPVLFGIFMGRNKTAGVKHNSDDARAQLEGVISIIANLMHYTKKCASYYSVSCYRMLVPRNISPQHSLPTPTHTVTNTLCMRCDHIEYIIRLCQ